MKTYLRKLASLFLTLCMVLTMLPASALATGTDPDAPKPVELPKTLEAVTAKASNTIYPEESDALGDVTLTTANMFPVSGDSACMYIELSGLTPYTTYYYDISYGDKKLVEGTGRASNEDGIVSISYAPSLTDLPKDTPVNLTLTLHRDKYYDTAISSHAYKYTYAPITFTTHLISSMPALGLSELNPDTPQVSTANLRPNVTVKLPPSYYDTLKAASALNVKLVKTVADKPANGETTPDESTSGETTPSKPTSKVYAVTGNDKPSAYSYTMADPRYNDIFQTNANISVSYTNFSTNPLLIDIPLEEGLYDMEIYDGTKLLYAVEDIVSAVDCPLVTYLYGQNYGNFPNAIGSDTAYANVTLVNGDPNDFEVELYQGGTLLGTSTGYHAARAYEGSIEVDYAIPLKTALKADVDYTFKVVSAKTPAQDFEGKDTVTFRLYTSSNPRTITDIMFGSRYYANFVLTTVGFDSRESYLAQLYSGGSATGTPLSETEVFPDETGLFEIEFTDETGNLIEVAPSGTYTVALKARNNAGTGWESNGTSKNVSNYERTEVASSVSLLSTEEEEEAQTIPVSVASNNTTFYSDEVRAYLRLRADSENMGVLSDLSKFTLQTTSVLGTVYTLTNPTGEIYDYNNGQRNYSLIFPSADLPSGHYTVELFYDGKQVVNASTGKNALALTSPRVNHDFPYAQPNSRHNQDVGLLFNQAIYGYSLTADTVTIDLFKLTNRSTTPDASLTVASPANAEETLFTEEQMASISAITPYRSVIYQNGVPINTDTYGYYSLATKIGYNLEDLPTYSVTADSAANGTLTILPTLTTYTDIAALPVYTDVYVQAVPAAGYRLKPGSLKVNGEALLGRGFPVTEDAVVTAEFELAPKTQYNVKPYSSSNGTITVNTDKAAAGDIITATVTPAEGYLLNYSNPPYYFFTGNSSNTYPMTENTDGTWSFIMPEGNVTVDARFRKPYNWQIKAASTNTDMGKVSLSADKSAELSNVVVTVSPADGYALASLMASHNTPDGSDTYFDLMKTPGKDPNTYILTLPRTEGALNYVIRITATFAERQSYAVNFASGTSAYGSVSPNTYMGYPGDTVTLTVYPTDGYKLQNNSLRVCSASTGTELTLTENADGTWSFTMPEDHVTVYYEFEEKTLLVPGGTVTSPETLQAALGGAEYAVLAGDTVSLISRVVLQNPLKVTSGTMTLDLNGKSITSPASGSVLTLSNGNLTITNNNPAFFSSMEAAGSSPALEISGGTLEVQASRLSIRTSKDSASAPASVIHVIGGNVTLGTPNATGAQDILNVEGMGTSNGLLISGGSVTTQGGFCCTSDNGSAILVKNTGNLTMNGGESHGHGTNGAAIHVDSSATGSVIINDGRFGGNSTALWVESTSASVQFFKLSTFDFCPVAFRGPADKGLQNYLASGSKAFTYKYEALTAEQLVSSTLNGAILVDMAYQITVTTDGNGTVTPSVSAAIPNSEVRLTVTPKSGYQLNTLTYSKAGSTDAYDIPLVAGMGYQFVMSSAAVTIHATFIPIPESVLLKNNRLSLHRSFWNGEILIPAHLNEQVNMLDYNTRYTACTLTDASGNTITSQERHDGGTWMNLANPGGLTTGKYKLYVTAGDASQSIPLGWQTIELVDAYTYDAHVPNRPALTPNTRNFPVQVYVECMPSQLPSLELQLLDQFTGKVLASSTSYALIYTGGEKGTAATNDKEHHASSTLRFQLDLGDHRLSSTGSYVLQLVSNETELMKSYENSLYIQDGIAIFGDYDADTMTWIGTAEGVPAGDYNAYSSDYVITDLTFHVEDDGTATVVFPSDPFAMYASSNPNIYINVDIHGSFYGFGFSKDEHSAWYNIQSEGGYYVNYNNNFTGTYIYYMIPAPESAPYTLPVTISGASGSGRYQLSNNMGNIYNGTVEDLSSFSIILPEVYYGCDYYLSVYDSTDVHIGQNNFQFRAEKALGFQSMDDFHSGGTTLTMYPLNMSDTEVDSLTIGYTTASGRVTLKHTVNSDGSITVNTGNMPYGAYRLWALYRYDGATARSEAIITSNPYSPSNKQASAVSVAPLEPVTDESGTITAKVEYVNGKPSSDVLMDIYLLLDGELTYIATKNIGKSSYTISSNALGLNGSYVFFFRTSGINTPAAYLGEQQADFVSTYSVTFLDWDGRVLSIQDVAPGSSATAPVPPSREGYTFIGWDRSFDKVSGNLTITARYSKDAVTVTFSAGAGTGAPAAIELVNGATLSEPEETPSRDGYFFNGWYTTPACTKPFAFDKTPITADTILYAGWMQQPLNIYTEGDAMIGCWPDGSSDGSAYAGDTILVEISSQPAQITSLTVLDMDGNVLQTLTPVQERFAYWSASFVMPDEDVTVKAETEVYRGSLSISSDTQLTSLQINCYESMYSEYYTYIRDLDLDYLPYGTYYITGNYYYNGNLCSWNETVVISAEDPDKVLNFNLNSLYTVSGSLSYSNSSSTGTLYLYAYDSMTGNYVSAAAFDSYAQRFTFSGMAPGTYTLYAYDWDGRLVLDQNTFTVSNSSIYDLNLTISYPMSVVTNLSAQDWLGAETAYLYLEQKVGENWYWVASQSGQADGASYQFDSAITEAGTYRVRVDSLTRPNGSGLAFESTPVEFTVTEDILASNTPYWTETLLYSSSLHVMDVFTGTGNLVALSKNDVYPGDYVELTIRYSTDYEVAPTFSLDLPAGVTRLDDTSLTVSEAATSGTIRLALKVAADAAETLSIPVQVTLNGETADFGTAAMSVAGVTLSAEPVVSPGVPFSVYGEAAPGSTVSIINLANNTLLATIPVTGRFYASQITLSDYDTWELQAQVVSNGNVIKSEKVSVSVDSQPVTISNVCYGYDPNYNSGINAKLNSKLNTYSFYQYVDMDLMGYNLPIAVTFENGSNIYAVNFTFCGRTYSAYRNYGAPNYVYYTTFDAGTWGGSGLKTLTAEVYTYNGIYTFDVAMVNLLIDPSGIVTDENGEPLEGVTVICQVYEDGQWVDLDAASIGQVNPQITDADGRYGWNVPEGEYRVLAFKEGYENYDSSADPNFGVLDIPPARNDINFSMKAISKSYAIYPTVVDGANVTVNSSAMNGETVTMTVAPVDGLLVDTVKVTTLTGTPVAVTDNANGTYSFKMPSKDVTFQVTTASEIGSSVEIASASANGTVKANFTKLAQKATMMVAFYDSNDRMVGVQSTTVASGAGTAQATATLSDTPAYVRVFLLDPTTRTPLMDSDEYSFS